MADEATLNVDLTAINTSTGAYAQPAALVGGAQNGSTSPYTAPTVVSKPKPNIQLDEAVVCLDVETTGTNPWDDQVLGVGLWDLREEKSQMAQFFSWDEETVIQQTLAWLTDHAPTVIVGYNQSFDQRHLLSRAMLYQIPCAVLFDASIADLMDLLKKGTWNSLSSSQATGAVEDWELYFWGDKKPYTIEECFEGIRNHDLTRLQLRNRSCVSGEGDLYLLARFVAGAEVVTSDTPHYTVETRELGIQAGVVEVQCPKCMYLQAFDLKNTSQPCIICGFIIPNPSPETYLHDVVRPLDYASVGLTATKTTTAKTTTTTKKSTTAAKTA